MTSPAAFCPEISANAAEVVRAGDSPCRPDSDIMSGGPDPDAGAGRRHDDSVDTAAGRPRGCPAVAGEERREFEKIRLIPSENYASRAVLEATGSVFTNKYSEGYAGKRYYEGQQCVDPLEQLAIARAKALFGADHANVQPYSGSPANLAVYFALLKPGDTVMGMALPHGGHLTHGWNVSITGTFFRSVQYGVQHRDRADRLRPGARAGAEGAAEADHRRRHRLPAHHRLRGDSARSPTRSARTCSWTSPTSPASSPAARTRARCRTPTWSPRRRTRRCADRAGRCSSARRRWRRRSTRPSSPASRAARTTTRPPASRWRSRKPPRRSSRPTRTRS